MIFFFCSVSADITNHCFYYLCFAYVITFLLLQSFIAVSAYKFNFGFKMDSSCFLRDFQVTSRLLQMQENLLTVLSWVIIIIIIAVTILVYTAWKFSTHMVTLTTWSAAAAKLMKGAGEF